MTTREEKGSLVREAQKSDFWQKVFLPEYQELHDILEVGAYEDTDIHRRYALIEAVRALRDLMMRITGYLEY
jgi:hypothetical protein